MSKPILVAVAWPYASGSRHLGHLAGAYLPADIFARYHRLIGNDVAMVSGSDVHGTPITVRADAEGVDPADIANRFHAEFVENWERCGIQWECYTSTGTDNHAKVTQEMFLTLLEKGHIDKRCSEQFYDEQVGRFLPDRYVEGTCPHCGYTDARGDQCDNCGRTLDPVDLIDPRSKMSGSVPVVRETEHFYLRLSDFSDHLGEWLDTRVGWRAHVLNFSKGWISEGLRDRAITRDLEWGVKIPVDDLGPGKRIYVWFDAVIGYLSAAKELSERRGEPDLWRRFWQNPEAESYYFIGKDNVPFHAIIWPAMLMGNGGLNLPTNVPANQYVTFKGGKASASRGVGLTINEGLDLFEPDSLRYALAASFPEQSDSDISIGEIARRINEELAATWGNLVNRVLSMIHKNHDGAKPAGGERTAEDLELLELVESLLAKEGDQIERVELKAGLRTAMDSAQAINVYLNATEPWRSAKTDPERSATVLATALDAINGARVGMSPYLPFSSAKLDSILGVPAGWERVDVPAGTPIPKPSPLFPKVDLEALETED